MSIQYLNAANFYMKEHQLHCNIDAELAFVFYSSPSCPNCETVLPVIQRLTQTIQGCSFAIVDMSQNYELSIRSRETSTPITYVPLVILYYKSRPFQIFKGVYELSNLQEFIVNAGKKIRELKIEESKNPEKKIPAYTTGMPYCDEESGICYLSFDSAYKKKNGN